MRKWMIVCCGILLLLTAGCGEAGKQTEPAGLTASDPKELLAGLDVSEATLACYDEGSRSETEPAYPAGAAIRADRYLETLRTFLWESAEPPAEQTGSRPARLVLSAPGVTLTACHSAFEEERLLHAVTEHGEGTFVLSEGDGEPSRSVWPAFETLSRWYDEAQTASLYGDGGTPLTPEELDWFEDYTASVWMTSDAYGEYPGGATEISCFFTSLYDTVAELDFEEFMRYFPGDGSAGAVTDREFEALKQVEVWPFKEVESRDAMPVPIHKYPRSAVDAVLTRYAGITTADLDTRSVAYLEGSDAYYTYTSDFGPGVFTPCYGEKYGDAAALWSVPGGYDGSSGKLTLQKSGDNWRILSHQSVNAEG